MNFQKNVDTAPFARVRQVIARDTGRPIRILDAHCEDLKVGPDNGGGATGKYQVNIFSFQQDIYKQEDPV